MREERLAGLQHGAIEIEVDAILNTDILSRTRPAGRGIVLVKTLCAEVQYPGCGNLQNQ